MDALVKVFIMTFWMPLLASAAILFTHAANAGEYLPYLSTATGKEIGRTVRTDGSYPSKERAIADKRSCLTDPAELPDAKAAELGALAKKDRVAAEIAIARAIEPCMAKRGWKIILN